MKFGNKFRTTAKQIPRFITWGLFLIYYSQQECKITYFEPWRHWHGSRLGRGNPPAALPRLGGFLISNLRTGRE